MTPDPELEHARTIAAAAYRLGWRGGWISDAAALVARGVPDPAPPAVRLPLPPEPPALPYAPRRTAYGSGARRDRHPARGTHRADGYLSTWGEKRKRRPA